MTLQELIKTYQVCSTSPTLLANINDFIGQPIKDYVDPSDTTRHNTKALIDALVAKNADAIKAATDTLGLQCYVLDNSPELVFYRHKDISKWPLVLYWNFDPKALQVVIEDPHNKSDLVFRVTARLVGNNDFWRPLCMISNAASRDCGHGKADGQPNRANSDCAHAWQCLFRFVSSWIYDAYPKLPHIQIHGMKGGANMHLLLHNAYNAQFVQNIPSICREFAYALTDAFPLEECNNFTMTTKSLPGTKNNLPYINPPGFTPGTSWFRQNDGVINTCVEARYINGGNAQNAGNRDVGLFAHLELRTSSFGMEGNEPRDDKLLKAIGEAVNNFIQQ